MTIGVTVGEVIGEAQGIINEVSGSGTQAYTEDVMRMGVIRAFDLIFTKYPWEHYLDWSTHVLDETIGIVSADAFDQVRGIEDFLAVHRDAETTPLPVLSKSTNPATVTGTKVRCWSHLSVAHASFEARRLQFFPATAVGSVNVLTRLYPATVDAPWTDDSTMYLDSSLLAYGAAFMQLIGDETNPGAALVAQKLMETRYSQIVGVLATRPLLIQSNNGIPSDWTTRP